MYKIVDARELTTNIYLFEVEAKRVAKSCLPGQFVIVRTNEDSERIPLTISDYNREKGTITIVVQTIGAGTTMMKSLKTGDYFHDFVGPLGKASDLCYEDIDDIRTTFEKFANQTEKLVVACGDNKEIRKINFKKGCLNFSSA